MADTSPPLWEALTTAAHEARPLLPMYLHLLASALFPIYAGAHASLSRPSSAARSTSEEKKQKEDDDGSDEEEDEDSVQKMEGLSNKDAIIFPITAATVLAGLYFLIKRYGADLINLILGWYFAGVGVLSVAKLVNDGSNFLLSFVFPTYFADRRRRLWKVRWNQGSKIILSGPDAGTAQNINSLSAALRRKYKTKAYIHNVLELDAKTTIVNLLAALSGVAVVLYANVVSKSWYLTNIQGFAVCYSALQIMSPTSFATGSLILGGLFFYDIWAVFFTPLMITVAKNLDQPIKLVFPRPDEPNTQPGEPPIKSYSMLGLGDIVLPGMMIALALRFDLYMFYLKKQKRSTAKSTGTKCEEVKIDKAPYIPVTGFHGDRLWSRAANAALPARLTATFPKPYFVASMVGYVIGMLATLGVMSVWHHAQPALLYLVPGVLIAVWGTGAARGEIKEMWEFTEAITGDQLDESSKEDEAKEEKVDKVDERTWWQFFKDEIFGTSAPEGKAKEGKEREKKDAEDLDKKADKKNNALISFAISTYDTPRRQSGLKPKSKQNGTAVKEASSE